jgi:hypothetical protein
MGRSGRSARAPRVVVVEALVYSSLLRAAVVFDFPLHVLVSSGPGCRRNASALRARNIGVLTPASVRAATMLCIRRESHNRCQCEN